MQVSDTKETVMSLSGCFFSTTEQKRVCLVGGVQLTQIESARASSRKATHRWINRKVRMSIGNERMLKLRKDAIMVTRWEPDHKKH